MNWFKSFWKALTTPLQQPRGDSPAESNIFTPRAQQVLILARKEAGRFNHNGVGTEHLLLGLIRLGQGTGFNVLGKMGLKAETVRQEVEKQVGTGLDRKLITSIASIPYTPRVKKVLALAMKEARALNHTYVGTEHILLGLLREGDGVAARVLMNLGVDTNVTRQYVLRELDPNYALTGTESTAARQACAKPPSDMIDVSKRYDVYCSEGGEEVVYRNALFRSTKKLLPRRERDVSAEFMEIEQADGKTIFIARGSITKFCEHVAGTGPE